MSAPDDDYVRDQRSAWMDVDWHEHQRWVTVEGRPVNVIDVGQGPAVLLVHGLAGAWQNWLENVCPLSQAHRVIAVDLPGFGHSAMPADDISITGYAHCLESVCDQLDVDRVAVVGNSMGGFVGADMAIAHPERVSHLVLVAAAVLWNERRRARPMATVADVTEAATALLFAQLREALRRPRLRTAALSQVVRFPARVPAALALEQLRHSGTPEAFGQALQALYHYKLRDRLPEIECPTLVLWGRDDQLVSVKDAATLADLIPNSRTEIFDDTGHIPMLERPARFNALIEEFVGAADAGAPAAGPTVAGASGPVQGVDSAPRPEFISPT